MADRDYKKEFQLSVGVSTGNLVQVADAITKAFSKEFKELSKNLGKDIAEAIASGLTSGAKAGTQAVVKEAKKANEEISKQIAQAQARAGTMNAGGQGSGVFNQLTLADIGRGRKLQLAAGRKKVSLETAITAVSAAGPHATAFTLIAADDVKRDAAEAKKIADAERQSAAQSLSGQRRAAKSAISSNRRNLKAAASFQQYYGGTLDENIDRVQSMTPEQIDRSLTQARIGQRTDTATRNFQKKGDNLAAAQFRLGARYHQYAGGDLNEQVQYMSGLKPVEQARAMHSAKEQAAATKKVNKAVNDEQLSFAKVLGKTFRGIGKDVEWEQKQAAKAIGKTLQGINKDYDKEQFRQQKAAAGAIGGFVQEYGADKQAAGPSRWTGLTNVGKAIWRGRPIDAALAGSAMGGVVGGPAAMVLAQLVKASRRGINNAPAAIAYEKALGQGLRIAPSQADQAGRLRSNLTDMFMNDAATLGMSPQEQLAVASQYAAQASGYGGSAQSAMKIKSALRAHKMGADVGALGNLDYLAATGGLFSNLDAMGQVRQATQLGFTGDRAMNEYFGTVGALGSAAGERGASLSQAGLNGAMGQLAPSMGGKFALQGAASATDRAMQIATRGPQSQADYLFMHDVMGVDMNKLTLEEISNKSRAFIKGGGQIGAEGIKNLFETGLSGVTPGTGAGTRDAIVSSYLQAQGVSTANISNVHDYLEGDTSALYDMVRKAAPEAAALKKDTEGVVTAQSPASARRQAELDAGNLSMGLDAAEMVQLAQKLSLNLDMITSPLQTIAENMQAIARYTNAITPEGMTSQVPMSKVP